MNKQELINELSKTRDEFFEMSSDLSNHADVRNVATGTYVGLMTSVERIRMLDEPEKPIVKQFVADWFEDNKDDLEFAIWKLTIDSNSNYTKNKRKMRHWIQHAPNKPYKTLIRMLEGYEIEKEPLFLMPVPYVPYPVHYCVDEDGKVSYRQGNAQKFTQEELDKYFPEIKQFAVPVEEIA